MTVSSFRDVIAQDLVAIAVIAGATALAMTDNLRTADAFATYTLVLGYVFGRAVPVK